MLLAFSSRVRKVLLTTMVITLVLSVLGSLLVSVRLARPINHLYREVIDAQEKKTFPACPAPPSGRWTALPRPLPS